MAFYFIQQVFDCFDLLLRTLVVVNLTDLAETGRLRLFVIKAKLPCKELNDMTEKTLGAFLSILERLFGLIQRNHLV